MRKFVIGLFAIFTLFVTPKVIRGTGKIFKNTRDIVIKNGDEVAVNSLKKSVPVTAIILDPKRPYNRDAINELFKIRRHEFHLEGLARGSNGKAVFTDIYTGKTLNGGDKFDYDHIISSHAVFEKYKHVLTDKQIAQLVNIKENIGPTMRPINKSKGKKDLMEWFKLSDANKKFGVKEELVKEQQRKATMAVERRVKELIRENG